MSTPLPTHIALILFPGFQLLDATGPLDALALLSLQKPLQLSILAATLDPVSTQNYQQTEAGSRFESSIVPTHTFGSVKDEDFDMVLLPGGVGAR
jgi:putative intracellular protease/amidase